MNEVWMTLGSVLAIGLLGRAVHGSRYVADVAGPPASGESRVIVTTAAGVDHVHNVEGHDVEAKLEIASILHSELGGKIPNAENLKGWEILYIRPDGRWVEYTSEHPDYPGQMVWVTL